MTPTPSREERERRRIKALGAARIEASQLAEIERLRCEENVPYAEGMRRVGLVLRHSTLQSRLNRLKMGGVEGLLDRRHAPPSRVTPEIKGFIEGLGRMDAALSVTKMGEMVVSQFKVVLAPRTIEDVLHQAGLARPVVRFTSEVQPAARRAVEDPPVEEPLQAAGMAWLTMGDDLVGYTAGLAEAIKEVTSDFPPAGPVMPEEREDRDERGRFLPSYNEPEPRRDPEVGARFESVEIKREDKDLGRLRIVENRLETLQAKLLTLMALPMVTDRGRFDGATDVRGTWLAGLDGIDFMPETLAKFGREMKWAGVSGALEVRHAQIWHREARTWIGDDACCSILYVDTTTKPLWTDHFHKSGRVAMLGRVMPCVETVMIHQGAGVPLWVRTYSGHVALVHNVLPLIDELESAIGEGMLGRLTVIDGEMDCVALFKQFDLRQRYFVVPLDRSRVKDLDAIQGLGELQTYRDGDRIGGGWLELTDSLAPTDPPYRLRAIALRRRTKDTFAVFGSNAPPEEFADDVLMDAYFNRWPKQEQIFRQLNGATSFTSAHGYGKQRVTNITVVDQLTKLEAQVQRAAQRFEEAKASEAEAVVAVREATQNHQDLRSARDTLQEWLQEVTQKHAEDSATYQQAVGEAREAASQVEVTKLRLEKAVTAHKGAAAKAENLEKTLGDKQALARQLESRREIYQTDVELDQILSVLKTGFLLVLQFLLHRFFASRKMDLLTFANQILLLPGVRIRTTTSETVRFFAHRRNPEMMEAIEEACGRFNALHHRHHDRLVRFELYWPPGTRDHAK